MRVLFAWIGTADLNAAAGTAKEGFGPIAAALDSRPFDRAELLSNWPDANSKEYVRWLGRRSKVQLRLHPAALPSPTSFTEIYRSASKVVELFAAEHRDASMTFHFSPGTPAMGAVWLLLAKARFRADLIQSSPEKGVEEAVVPFEISADFNPELLRQPDDELTRLVQGLSPQAPEFDAILHRCDEMKRLVARARRLAPRNVSVLILGESGTGKELIAKALHSASPRKDRKLIAVNCGAIPEGLADSELFGHVKGAFTGAQGDQLGKFEAADGGTLFLDEVGELPSAVQVRLLRVLQEREVVRVGDSKPRKVDVRVIAATHRNLFADVAEGRFREDLFYRLAVGVLRVPALRDRHEDLDLLVDALLSDLEQEAAGQPGFEPRKLAPGARSRLRQHSWPGNIRELRNALLRASMFATGSSITSKDIEDALLPTGRLGVEGVLGRALGGTFEVERVLREVREHYLARALQESGGNKAKAAKLLGLASGTTFDNWLKKARGGRK